MSPPPTKQTSGDGSVWIDVAGFAGGLGLAWWQQWKTADLVWSLWLSSLIVGYAMIVWIIVGPALVAVPNIWRDRGNLAEAPARWAGGLALTGLGMLFLLAFFTLHFGGFHVVHSVFLAMFFPLQPGETGFPGWSAYAEVARRYWLWLPIAFLAERAAFSRAALVTVNATDTAVTPAAIAKRKAKAQSSAMTAPYLNVIRMHLLIFFFAAAHFAKLENFFVYAVVYAVYFAPWRRLARVIRPDADWSD